MMRCPKCGGMDFTIAASIQTLLYVRCTEDGDYEERDEERTGCEWHWMQCRSSGCGETVDEEAARDAFDAWIAQEEDHDGSR